MRVSVIGAGIVGVSTAIWLQRAGHDVTLIDREGPAAGASFGNGGVLASAGIVPVTTPGLVRRVPGMLLRADAPLFLKWRYLPRALPWLVRYLRHANAEDAARRAAAIAPIIGDSLADHQALSEGTKAATYVVPSDYIYLYDRRADFEADAFGWDLRRAHGITWDVLGPEDLRAYDPALGPRFGCGIRMGGHGRISDPGAYIAALTEHFQAEGGRLLIAAAEGFAQEGGRVTGVRLKGETLSCDAVVVATGAWSCPLAAKLGVRPPLETERGYHLELWKPSSMPRAPLMLASAKFVVTPMEGRIRLAGIVEIGGLDAAPSAAPIRLLERGIRAAMPGLSWERQTSWLGHRPAMADSIPVIGEVPALKGAFLGFGHDHVGLTGGPKTGRILAQLVGGQTPNIDLAPYAPGRFA
ncbi:MAG: FAD-dependent oxidoreductase [Pseudomonadota bacterium]